MLSIFEMEILKKKKKDFEWNFWSEIRLYQLGFCTLQFYGIYTFCEKIWSFHKEDISRTHKPRCVDIIVSVHFSTGIQKNASGIRSQEIRTSIFRLVNHPHGGWILRFSRMIICNKLKKNQKFILKYYASTIPQI